MVIQQGPDVVDIAVLDRLPTSSRAAGDLCMRVSVACRGFKARRDVWISREAFDEFLDQFRALDRARRGTATLQALSPQEFQLRLSVIDPAGHTSIDVELGHTWHDHRAHQATLAVSFEFDPSRLPRALQQLEALAPAV